MLGAGLGRQEDETVLYRLGDREPQVADGCFIADTARVIGSVRLHPGASVWYGAVLRGDCDWIEIGPDSNIQDGAVLHTDPGIRLVVGRGVTVGHMAMLHGCTIGDGSLIGIGAIVLNGARIGAHCVIGAGALVTEGTEIPDGSLVVGAPAKVRRALGEAERKMLALSAQHYRQNAERFAQSLSPIPWPPA